MLSQIILIFISLFSLAGFVLGIRRTTFKNQAFQPVFVFNLIGAFVWADVVIFGLFWFLISLICFFLQDFLLFLLIVSLFWAVRSFGEIIYWLNQQFAGINRNPPEKFRLYPVFKNDSIWFVYQIFWQCLLVVCLVASIYFTHLWLKTI